MPTATFIAATDPNAYRAKLASQTAAIMGCAMRAPHHSCTPSMIADEIAMAAGAVLFVDDAGSYAPHKVLKIAHLLCRMPNPPALIVSFVSEPDAANHDAWLSLASAFEGANGEDFAETTEKLRTAIDTVRRHA
jgi:hypothetical protein